MVDVVKNTKKQKAKQRAVDAIEKIVHAAKDLAQAERVYYGRRGSRTTRDQSSNTKEPLFSKLYSFALLDFVDKTGVADG